MTDDGGHKPRPTMMDVAARAGVSQATVSLVLNGSPGARLAAATRERVRAAAQELGYRLARRGPRQVPADKAAIGVIVDEIATDPWTSIALDGMRDKAWEYGLTVTLAVSRGDREMEEALVQQMQRQPVVGVIYGTILTRRVDLSPAFRALPVVLHNCYDARRRLASVVPGDLVGGFTATERLTRAGHRRIGFINGQDGIDASRDRLRGYRQALASADIPFDPALVQQGNWEPSSGFEGTRALMALADPPTAIFCGNDMMAVGCYEALKESGLEIPRDVAVIGFDDREIAQFMRPPLTTLVLPHYEMGVTAAEILIDGMGRSPAPQIKVECPLVERASVGPVGDGDASGYRGELQGGQRTGRRTAAPRHRDPRSVS
jgi:LacI family transcriptional regulator